MKRIKMVLYGEPGVGKSVFASKAPKPFFITSDGNYEWLEDFGADPNAHIEVSSWSEAKKAFQADYSNYETIVVDLLEDLFKWCEYEYCQKNHIDHVSDHGYGKGYDATRNEFFVEICKLISIDKNIIFIMHGLDTISKDRRGVEHVKHIPSTRLPDKLIDMIEGRVRYFLRCYVKAEDDGTGLLIKHRYLSLIPKENEFGIARGIDENKVPADIPLDFDEFARVIGLYDTMKAQSNITNAQKETTTERKDENEETPVKRKYVRRVKTEEQTPESETVAEQLSIDTQETENSTAETESNTVAETKVETQTEEPVKTETTEEKVVVNEQAQPEVKPANTFDNDKLAALRARLAARKNNI